MCVGEVGSRGWRRARGVCMACAGRVLGVCGVFAGRVRDVRWKLGWEACVGRAWGVRGACVWDNKCWYRSLRFTIRIPW